MTTDNLSTVLNFFKPAGPGKENTLVLNADLEINGTISGTGIYPFYYDGNWNASTNSPALQSSVGTQGHFYIVTVAGTTNLNGITNWTVGDWALFNNGAWSKIDFATTVVSVNGQTGTVILTKTDIGLSNVDNTSDANKPVSTATQTALDLKESTANKGATNGYAPLDINSKVPLANLPQLGGLSYLGGWNASTNSPTITSGQGSNGQYYVVTTPGSTNIDGINSWANGDWIIFQTATNTWQKIDTSDIISSVFGRTGVVTAQSGDYNGSQVTVTPYGYFISASNVQEALQNLNDTFSGRYFYSAAVSDETSVITTGTNKIKFVIPYASSTLTKITATLNTASSSGSVVLDIKKTGVGSVLSSNLTISASSKLQSATSGFNFTNFTFGDEVTIDITSAGTNAVGLKIIMFFGAP